MKLPMKLPIIILSFIVLSGVAPSISADMIWQKNADQPRYGWVIDQNDETIVFREFGSNESAPIELKRIEFLTIVVNIDHGRLESLHPRDWSAYRNYAEELAAQKRDPTARQLAVRLYLIAANGSSGAMQQSCLSGLVALAENESQRTKWRTLQRLIHPASSFNTDSPHNLPNSVSPSEIAAALEMVRMVRRGLREEALKRLTADSTVSSSTPWSDLVSIDQLTQMATQERLTQEQLHRLLQMELALLDSTFASASDSHRESTTPEDWTEMAQSGAATITEIPSFKNITPFDPEACVYRGNRWVRP